MPAQEPQPEETSRSSGNNQLEKFSCDGLKAGVEDCGSPSHAESACRAHPGSSPSKPQRPAALRAVHGGTVALPNPTFHRDVPVSVPVSVPSFPADLHLRPGFHGLFQARLIYGRDSDLRVLWKLTLKTNTNGHKLDPPACWVVDGKDLQAESSVRCFREPRRLASVAVLQSSSDVLSSHNYFMRSSSCRFYLSLHRDHVSEPFRAPPARLALAARRNSGSGAPAVPSVHTGDLPDAARLAEFLLSLDTDYKSFMSLFKWRQFYKARRGLREKKEEFLSQS